MMGLLRNFSLMTLVSYSATTQCSCVEALSLPHITYDIPICPELSTILQWEQSPSLSGTTGDLSLSLSQSGGPAVLCATEGSVTPPSVPFITVTRCCFLWVLSIHFHTYSPWPFLSGVVVPGPPGSEMEAAMTAPARLWLSSRLEHTCLLLLQINWDSPSKQTANPMNVWWGFCYRAGLLQILQHHPWPSLILQNVH